MLPQMLREPINVNNDDAQYEVVIAKKMIVFSVESIVAMQEEDEGPWVHALVEDANGSEHKG